ncbi:MAG TPA: hypothetical protein VFA45_16760 [Actinomycetes bacterium]|nr:hypothetical protein [Actinomycetes bacterium]
MHIVLAQEVSFPTSPFVPIAVGFFGLGTGYLIYGPQELFRAPGRSRPVDLITGIWGIWMPGFMQFVTGVILFVGLAWLHSFRDPPLYMAALAFTAYGVHWWAIGMGRAMGGDPRPNAFMSVAFTMISALGIVVFFLAHDAPVAGLFIGLTCVYVADFFASLYAAPATGSPEPAGHPVAASDRGPGLAPGRTSGRRNPGVLGERALGIFHLGTGMWLMYLTWATVLNIANGKHLPL